MERSSDDRHPRNVSWDSSELYNFRSENYFEINFQNHFISSSKINPQKSIILVFGSLSRYIRTRNIRIDFIKHRNIFNFQYIRSLISGQFYSSPRGLESNEWNTISLLGQSVIVYVSITETYTMQFAWLNLNLFYFKVRSRRLKRVSLSFNFMCLIVIWTGTIAGTVNWMPIDISISVTLCQHNNILEIVFSSGLKVRLLIIICSK